MAATFSYAQAAKGQSVSSPSTKASSTGASGTATPASTSVSEATPSSTTADDAEPSYQGHSHARSDDGKDKSTSPTQSRPSRKSISGETKVTDEPPSVDSTSLNDSVVDRDSNSEAKSESNDKTVAPATDGKESKALEETDGPANQEDKTPPKPKFQEAKPPVVNIWAQRAADRQVKQSAAPPKPTPSHSSAPSIHAVGSESGTVKPDSRRKSEQSFGREAKRADLPPRPRDDFRNSKFRRDTRAEDVANGQKRFSQKPRDRASSEAAPPSVNSSFAWPKPQDAPQGEKKPQGDKDEKERTLSGGAGPHGKTEWKSMAFTPSVVFQTKLDAKGGPRVGKGSARPGPPPITPRVPLNGFQGDPASQPAVVNGERDEKAITNGKSHREAMPPPGKSFAGSITTKSTPFDSSRPSDRANGTSESLEKASDAPYIVQSLMPNDVEKELRPRPAEEHSTSNQPNDQTPTSIGSQGTSMALSTDGPFNTFVPGADKTQAPRSHFTERRSEPHLFDSTREQNGFREPRRGGRKSGGRGGFPAGPFASPTAFNSFQDFANQPYGAPNSNSHYATRGGQSSGRGSYRNHGNRSQSIPIENYGRPMPPPYNGYPVMQSPQFMPPYFDAPYSAGPYPMHSATEQDLIIGQVLMQVEYYFSLDNLLKDIFLRKHMDSQGWVFLQVVAKFKRMLQITNDYDILKTACLQSGEVEIRIGADGKDRLRRVRDWEQFVLPMEERDPSAQNAGATDLRRPSPIRRQISDHQGFYPQSPTSMLGPGQGHGAEHSFSVQDGASAPFFPGHVDPRFGTFIPLEELRGRPPRPHPRADGVVSATSNGPSEDLADLQAEPDRFPSTQIESLNVLVRKADVPAFRPSLHNANSRTFSNGSIDSRNIMEEITSAPIPSGPQLNGSHPSDNNSTNGTTKAQDTSDPDQYHAKNDLNLFWVKDNETPIDVAALPMDTKHELYTVLHSKALAQREAAATGNCPYDLDVLYQFWSHFLIRNFNSSMYHEFRNLATEDATHRHSNVGMSNLISFYSESLSSPVPIREAIARHFADLIKSESVKGDRPAMSRLRETWRSTHLNLKNRKKLCDLLDDSARAELEI